MRPKLVLLGLLMTLGVRAATADSMWLGFRGGVAIPSGNFNEIANSGWDAGGTVGWMYNQHSGLGVDVIHHDWGGGPNPKAEAVGGPGAGFSPSALQITACYLRGFPTEGTAFPWFKLGVGSYASEMKVEGGQVDSHNRTQRFGANLGIGADFSIGPGWRMGMGATYHHFQRIKVPPPGPTFIFLPEEQGGDFEATDAFTIDVGLTWTTGDRRGH